MPVSKKAFGIRSPASSHELFWLLCAILLGYHLSSLCSQRQLLEAGTMVSGSPWGLKISWSKSVLADLNTSNFFKYPLTSPWVLAWWCEAIAKIWQIFPDYRTGISRRRTLNCLEKCHPLGSPAGSSEHRWLGFSAIRMQSHSPSILKQFVLDHWCFFIFRIKQFLLPLFFDHIPIFGQSDLRGIWER